MTAKLVAEQLRDMPAPPSMPRAATDIAEGATQDPAIVEAVERDLAGRYMRAMRRSFFRETAKVDEFESLADVASEAQYANVASELRRRILLRASRSVAVRGSVEKAEVLLSAAQALPGADSDVLAHARIMEKRGDIDGALALLRDANDADSRSTVLNILFRHRGGDAALKWFSDEGLAVRDLTTNGVQTLSVAYLQKQDIDGLRLCLEELTSAQLEQAPYFRFLRAAVSLASVLPVPDRELALRGFPMDVRRGAHSILDDATTAFRLDAALTDLTVLIPITAELELREGKRLGEGYTRWCELLHPHRKDAGIERLRKEMKDPKVARGRLPLAFAFDSDFNPEPLEKYLSRREELGGLDDDDLQASLILKIHGDDPGAVASLIARHRARFEAGYEDPPIFTIEIQALALAGETSSARLLMEKHRSQLTSEAITGFEAFIAKAEGKDPVAEDLRVYESNKTVDALRTLVMSLARKKYHRATAKYSEDLYSQTSDPQDIARSAQAFVFLGDGPELIRVMEAYPLLQDRESGLTHQYAWELFRAGHLKDAKKIAERLTKFTPSMRDLQLEIAIAIESGEWESLAKPLAAFLDDIPKHSGLTLIRAAHIAQASGQGPMMDLIRAAISKAEDNPHVWLGAYTIIIEEGLEDDVPGCHDWFHRALVLSDKDGPVQQFELKELVPKQVEWNARTRDISDRITRAEVPLVIAAPGLRTTVVDILLRNLVRNSQLEDARRKYVIPLFSGHRAPEKCGTNVVSLGLDVSSLLVLGWVGLLRKVFETFGNIALPASVLVELFDGRRRVQQVQKSRIKRVRELEQAILRNRIKITRPTETPSDSLATEIGPSLAALIRTAVEADGVVLRPAPVHHPGLEQIPADVTAQLPQLSDMHTLLSVLVDKGVVDQAQEETARKYFELQDKGLPGCARPDPNRPLFIDGLALVYLQYTNLLDAVLKVFKDVRIEGDAEDEALAIIDHNQHIEKVLAIIDDTRNAIRDANASGKITFGPRRAEGEDLRENDTPSTLHLLSDLAKVDALVCDDRALNKENFAADANGTRIPCMSTLDLMEELRARGVLSDADWSATRHKLRVGGASIMPVQPDEILHATTRSRATMSAEMRAIQESIDLARVADIPVFPREIQWFAKLSMAMKSALMQVWQTEKDHARAAVLSNMILRLVPKPEDWASRWEAGTPPEWIEAVSRITAASMAMPVELHDDETVDAYNNWFGTQQLEPLRAVSPERYRAVVEHVRAFIESSPEEDNDEEEKP
jgi:hypothetical protein